MRSRRALTKGIIIADTKFEFGLDDNGTLTLMDEVLTPDFVTLLRKAMKRLAAGMNPPATTNSLCATGWKPPASTANRDKTPPAPHCR
jgi:phosphoribosylaminoimidazole-succinocarboxamide synthase